MASGLFVCSAGRTLLPLVSVHVDVVVVRCVAQQSLTQTYVNPGSSAIQAEYVFPLPDGASVIEFSASFKSGRRVNGVIKERSEAKRRYEKALQHGGQAALLEEKRPDIFQASIGNLGPGEEVAISVQHIMELPVEQGAVRLTIPCCVTPRYTPVGAANANCLDMCRAYTAGAAVAAAAMKQLFSADITWDTGGLGVERLESPTHPSLIMQHVQERGHASARLEGGTLDADIVLTTKPEDIFQPVVMWEEWANHDTQALMLSFVPQFELPQIENAEVTFVVDCSGSMGGPRILQLREAMRTCFRLLPQGCSFNIVKFGSTFEAMLPQSLPCSEESLRMASSYINGLHASMGGTEILKPLTFVLDARVSCAQPNHRQIILLTDGQVTNEQHIIDHVRHKQCRIFALGIGNGVGTFLVRGLARVTHGHAAFVQDDEKLEPICMSILKKALTPGISNLKVTWPSLLEDDFVVLEDSALAVHDSVEFEDVCKRKSLAQASADSHGSTPRQLAQRTLSFFDPQQKDPKAFQGPLTRVDGLMQAKTLQQAPHRPPVIFADSHFCAFALYPVGACPHGEVKVTGETVCGPINLRLSLPGTPVKRVQGPVHRMAARALIRDMEEGDAVKAAVSTDDATRLSLQFSVLSKSTAFVAVDQSNGCEHPMTIVPRTNGGMRANTAPMNIQKSQDLQVPHAAYGFLQGLGQSGLRAPRAVTNSVSWRTEGIKYQKNELFVNATENLRWEVGADGSFLSSEIQGAWQLISYLSGMPELNLLLNNKYDSGQVNQASFHQGVRARCGSLMVLPPDQECQLMSYCLSKKLKAPIKMKTLILPCHSTTRYDVQVQSTLNACMTAHNMEIKIPLPMDVDSVILQASHGMATYEQQASCVHWHVGELPGQKELTLSIDFCVRSCVRNLKDPQIGNLKHLGASAKPEAATVSFDIEGVLLSGFKVQNVKVIEKSGYQVAKHIRYHTFCRDCRYRIV